MEDSQSIFRRPERGSRGPAPGHTRDEIVAAAVTLADAEGLAAVSMRAVAGKLGTGAGSLYRYLSSRDDLLALMADSLIGTLRPFAVAPDPIDALLLVGRAQLELFRAHPWLVDVAQRQTAPGPHALAYFDHCLGLMTPLRCPPTAKFEAIAMLTGVVTLFSRPAAAGFSFGDLDPVTHANIIAAFGAPPGPAPATDLFERTVRSLLRGLLAED